MAAGLAQLRELEAQNGWARLEQLGAMLEESVRKTLRSTGRDFTFHRVGSMFCLFFTSAPVWDLASAQKSDRQAFARFFHGCLEQGIYFAPSQFETGFISVAHTEQDLATTAKVAAKVLASI